MLFLPLILHSSGESRGGARGAGPPPLILVKKEEITEEEKTAGQAKPNCPPPPVSSRFGSATSYQYISVLDGLALLQHYTLDMRVQRLE